MKHVRDENHRHASRFQSHRNSGHAEQSGKFPTFQNDFQQLGQDLQAGKLSQAQKDFVTLSQNFPAIGNAIGNDSNNPIAQAFSALSNDSRNGNLSAAQPDFSTIHRDFQQQQGSGQVQHHHGHLGGSGQVASQIANAFNSSDQALQSDDLSGAQSAFATLEQSSSKSACPALPACSAAPVQA